MIRGGFLDSASPQHLTELARNGTAAHRLVRRANALVLLDDGMSCEAAATLPLTAIEAMYPGKQIIHVSLDNARYHHAKRVQQWLTRPGCRIKLPFVPVYCAHLDAIERLRALMRQHATHNKCHPGFKAFTAAVLGFLRDTVPRNRRRFCDEVSGNFRNIDPADCRGLA